LLRDSVNRNQAVGLVLQRAFKSSGCRGIAGIAGLGGGALKPLFELKVRVKIQNRDNLFANR
jgi:hypothetical protein